MLIAAAIPPMTQTRIPGTERHFRISTPDLRLLGVTRSQIHEWARNRGDREAIIQAAKVSRHTRGAPVLCFDLAEAATVAVLARVRSCGFSLAKLAKVAPAVRRWYREHGGDAAMLTTDGERVFIEPRVDRIAAELGRNATVDLGAEWARVANRIG